MYSLTIPHGTPCRPEKASRASRAKGQTKKAKRLEPCNPKASRSNESIYQETRIPRSNVLRPGMESPRYREGHRPNKPRTMETTMIANKQEQEQLTMHLMKYGYSEERAQQEAREQLVRQALLSLIHTGSLKRVL